MSAIPDALERRRLQQWPYYIGQLALHPSRALRTWPAFVVATAAGVMEHGGRNPCELLSE
jgi:hypothetical protein